MFVTPDEAGLVLEPLAALGVDVGPAEREIRKDGQARVMWGHTPIDLFFAYDEFHRAAQAAVVEVPFAGTTITVLSAAHLTVCKVVFDRAKDWVDIDAMINAGTAMNAGEVLRWVGRIAGDDDPRYDRIAALLSATG